MDPAHLPALFPAPLLSGLLQSADLDPARCVRSFAEPGYRDELAAVEVLITGWGCPAIDESALEVMPRLRAILHSAGSVRYFVSESCWERGILVSTAAQANAVPVAEFTLAAILFAAKDAFGARERYRTTHLHQNSADNARLGAVGRKVGVIGASRVGRLVLERLRTTDLDVHLSDPYVTADEATALGARLLDLDDLLATCDIVSLHAPDLPQTRHLLDRRRLALIPDSGVFINTARGAIVDERALIDELESGRISAVLDVTAEEPPADDSPLYRLPNVFLTPHIAGSLGNELSRLGQTVADELDHYRTGQPLVGGIPQADLSRIA
ncbi:MAG: hydroxyacid dehydrogenase [Actinocrinis sp.]